MKIHRNNKPTPPPSIREALEAGRYREIPRHELHPGSWQRDMYDNGRHFYESTGKDAQPLAHFAKGRPAVKRVDGELRYMYKDGTIDPRSTVSPEVEERAFEVESIDDLRQAKRGEVAEVSGKVAVDEARIDAASMYGLHGQDLDDFLASPGAESQAA